MKIMCRQCGCHFPQDFPVTNEVPCNLWGDHGFTNLPIEGRKKIWDWIFSMPSDEFAVQYKTSLTFGWGGQPIIPSTEFKNLVPNWDELEEVEKQKYEREHFKKMFQEEGPDKKLEPAKRIN